MAKTWWARRGAQPTAPEIREKLLPHQRWRCICGKTIGAEESTVEHVFSRTHMGPRKVGNTYISCRRCNASKADRYPTGCELIFLFWVNARIGMGPTKVAELWPHLRRRPKVDKAA